MPLIMHFPATGTVKTDGCRRILFGRDYVDAENAFVTACSAGGTLTLWLVAHSDPPRAASANCVISNFLVMPDMAVEYAPLQTIVLASPAGLVGAFALDESRPDQHTPHFL